MHTDQTIQRAIALARQGHSRQQIAEAISVTWPTINRWLSQAGVIPINVICATTKTARNAAIAASYAAGSTADAIAAEHGISDTRVYTILRKQGVQVRQRGRTAAGPRKPKPVSRAERFAAILAADGLAIEEFGGHEQFVDALQKFRDQRMRSKQRGIAWDLSFGQWWRIWAASGKWSMRGRSVADSAVMARVWDVGPYSYGNVYITTLAKNFVDSHLVRGHHIKGLASHEAIISSCPLRVFTNASEFFVAVRKG